jgi:hypothetical protein
MDKPTGLADYYLELRFKSDIYKLDPGSYIEIKTRFTKSKNSQFLDHSNDYSYNPNAEVFIKWDKVTMYKGGVKIYGIEPTE